MLDASTTSNNTPSSPISSAETNQAILQQLTALLSHGAGDRLSLRAAAARLEIPLQVRSSNRRASVMVIGNVSAGKSTFVNWYAQEALQKTGMAVETSGFTIVTAGRMVNEIVGEAALLLRPDLEPLCRKVPGLLPNLSVRTCPSTGGHLSGLDLIDSPGLADGELQYAFDVESVILDLAVSHVDLILCLFDPVGQALGTRLLNVVSKLSDTVPEKVRYCLSKSDEIKSELDRIKIMCQTTQSLTARINSRHGFDLIPIFVPGAADGTYLNTRRLCGEESSVNRIGDIVLDIQRAAERRIQEVLLSTAADVKLLSQRCDAELRSVQLRHNAAYCGGAAHSILRAVFRLALCLIGVLLYVATVLSQKNLVYHPFFGAPAVALVRRLRTLRVALAESPIPQMASSLDRLADTLFRPIFVFFMRDPRQIAVAWVTWTCLFAAAFLFKRTPPKTANSEEANLRELRNFLSAAQLKVKQLQTAYFSGTLEGELSA